jgi:hypothetical protein
MAKIDALSACENFDAFIAPGPVQPHKNDQENSKPKRGRKPDLKTADKRGIDQRGRLRRPLRLSDG